MNERNIVVIGASAGGVEAPSGLVSHLPAKLAAALFVVLHVPRGAPSALPSIPSRAGSGHTTAHAHFAEQARDCAERTEVIRRTIMAGRPEPAAVEPAGPLVDEPQEGAA